MKYFVNITILSNKPITRQAGKQKSGTLAGFRSSSHISSLSGDDLPGQIETPTYSWLVIYLPLPVKPSKDGCLTALRNASACLTYIHLYIPIPRFH